MTIARKTQAKYGAQIPTARAPAEARAAQQSKRAAPSGASSKTEQSAKGSEGKKA